MAFDETQVDGHAGLNDRPQCSTEPFTPIGGPPDLSFPLPSFNRADPYPFDQYALIRNSFSTGVDRIEYGCGYLSVQPNPGESLAGAAFASLSCGRIPTVGGLVSFVGPVGTSLTITSFTGGVPFQETFSTPFSVNTVDIGAHWHASATVFPPDFSDRSADVHVIIGGQYCGAIYAGLMPLGLPGRYPCCSTLVEYALGDTDNSFISSVNNQTPPTVSIGSLSAYGRYIYLRGDGGGLGAHSFVIPLGLIDNASPINYRPYAMRFTHPANFPSVLNVTSANVVGVPS